MPRLRFRHITPALRWGLPLIPPAILTVTGGFQPWSVAALLGFTVVITALVHWAYWGRVRVADRAEARRLYRALERWLDQHPSGHHSPDGGQTIYRPNRRWVTPSVLRVRPGEADPPAVDAEVGVALYEVFTLDEFPTITRRVDGVRFGSDGEGGTKHLPIDGDDRRWPSLSQIRRRIQTDRSGYDRANPAELRALLADLERAVPVTLPGS